jgi:hypothetical protein
VGIELEPLRVGPNITGILRYKERQISNQANSTLVSIFLQAFPLTEQKELSETTLIDLCSQVEARAGQGLGIAPEQLLRPIQEISALVLLLQCPEERVIVQPMSLL